jgi:hypothetical protein
MKGRKTRKMRGGSANKLVNFTFSATLHGNAQVNYPEKVLAWYREIQIPTYSDMYDLNNFTLKYNRGTNMYEGQFLINKNESNESIKDILELFVDPDDDGNYPIIINKNNADSSSFEIYDDNNYNNNNNENKRPPLYLVIGRLEAFDITTLKNNNNMRKNNMKNTRNRNRR